MTWVWGGLEALAGTARAMRSRRVTRFLSPAAGRLAEERVVTTGERLRTEGLMEAADRVKRGGSVDRSGGVVVDSLSLGSSSSSSSSSTSGARAIKRKMDEAVVLLAEFLGLCDSVDLEASMPMMKTDVAAAMQDGARIDVVSRHFDVAFPNILLSWLWFRRYILAYPERCVPEMEDCHCWGVTAVGEPWAISEAEYPVALRGKATAELDLKLDAERALHEVRLEFEGHVRWFRRLVLASDMFEVVRYGGRDGIGLRMVRSCELVEVRRALVRFAFPVKDMYFEALNKLGYTSLLRDGRWGYVVFGPLALCQNGGVLRFGEVFRSGFDWKKSAELSEVGRLGEVVTERRGSEVFVLRVKDDRTVGERARARADLTKGSELLIRYSS